MPSGGSILYIIIGQFNYNCYQLYTYLLNELTRPLSIDNKLTETIIKRNSFYAVCGNITFLVQNAKQPILFMKNCLSYLVM